MRQTLIAHLRAGFAGLYLLTPEDARAEAELREVTQAIGYQLYHWSITRGLLHPATGQVQAVHDPVDAVNALAGLPAKTLLVLSDFHQFLGDAGQPA